MIKVVFLSNYFNHHQEAFSNAMYCNNEVEYFFIATSTMREERRKLGYKEENLPDYVIRSYLSDETKKKVRRLINNADVVIVGSAPEKMVCKRIQQGKLVVRYSERPLKYDISKWEYMKLWIKLHIKNPNNKLIYLLCASAYAYSDYQKLGLFKNQAYKWGYFPITKYYKDINELLIQKNRREILWCGRLIKWKNPQYAIEIAKRLKEEKYDFNLKIIGSGEEEKNLKEIVNKYEINDVVSFMGSMPPETVRLQMEKAGIYLFTSNKQEGWGAVLNEAMNSGCAVVASNSTGSTPYLIKDYINGIIYRSDNVDELYEKVKFLLDNIKVQEELGIEAYRTILEMWNAEIASERLIKLVNAILANKNTIDLYLEGPCSKA